MWNFGFGQRQIGKTCRDRGADVVHIPLGWTFPPETPFGQIHEDPVRVDSSVV